MSFEFPKKAPPVYKPEVQALLDRGNVTMEDVKDLRCNSNEWRALQLVMTDEAFIERMEYAISNCGVYKISTYNDAVIAHFAPELIRRFKVKS